MSNVIVIGLISKDGHVLEYSFELLNVLPAIVMAPALLPMKP